MDSQRDSKYTIRVLHGTLEVIADPGNVLGPLGTGAGLWNAATELMAFFNEHAAVIAGKAILELGAGVGTLGQVVLSLPDRAEMPAFISLAQQRGFLVRPLHHSPVREDLPTAVTIYQLIWQGLPAPPAATRGVGVASITTYHADPEAPSAQPAERVQVANALQQQGGKALSTAVTQLLGPARPLQSQAGCSKLQDAAGPRTGLHAGPRSGPILLTLDFDWTMVEENSDTFVLQQVGAGDSFLRLQTEGLPWTQLMDASLLAANSEHGATAADIIAACQRVPMDGALQEVLREAGALHLVDMAILSDANSVYIDSVAEVRGLQMSFLRVKHILMVDSLDVGLDQHLNQARTQVNAQFNSLLTFDGTEGEGAAPAKAGSQQQRLEGNAQPATPQGLPRPSAASPAASERPQEPEIASIAVTSSDGWDADNGEWNASGSGEAGWSFQEVSLDSPKARAARGRARPQARPPKQQTAPALSNGSSGPEVLLTQLRQENQELRARLADVEGAAAEVLGELEDEKEANAAAQWRSNAATAQAAKLQMDLHALQQEAEQARQEADAQVATAASHSPEPASSLNTAASTPAKAGSQVSGQASEATFGEPQQQEASQKDLQIAEFKQRLVKAKRQLVSWKQQVADATAAKEEAIGQLQAAQAQLAQQQEAAPDADVEGLRAQLAAVSAAKNVAVERLQAAQAQLAQQHQEAAGVDPAVRGLQPQLADATAAKGEALAQIQAAQAQLEAQQVNQPKEAMTADADAEELRAQLAEVGAARDAAVSALQAAKAQQAGCLGPEEAVKLQQRLAEAAAARTEAEARLTTAEGDWERQHQHAEAAASEAQQRLEAAIAVGAAAVSKAQEAEGRLAQQTGQMLETDAVHVNAGVAKVDCRLLLDLLFVSPHSLQEAAAAAIILAAAALPLSGAGSVQQSAEL
eukprot:jgi/Astpho2/2074/Aster-x1034